MEKSVLFTNLIQKLDKKNILYSLNEPLAPKSTFKVGSTCSLFLAPKTLEQFKEALTLIINSKIPFYILGGGSNTVFPDTNYDGVIISTENLKKIDIVDTKENKESTTVYIRCLAGTPVQALVNFCTDNCLTGMEQFAGLPGSVGGAVYMNARCFNKSINELFSSAIYITPDTATLDKLDYNEEEWAYKKSPFQPKNGSGAIESHKYVLEVIFKLTKISSDNKADIEQECKKYINERVSKGHFKFPSAGSVFKNNRAFGKPSGQLIDEAGLRGIKIGGAQIAPFHGNFIINIGNAKQEDIKALVAKVIDTVQQRFNFTLEAEIIFL